jgi:hypothetical protein
MGFFIFITLFLFSNSRYTLNNMKYITNSSLKLTLNSNYKDLNENFIHNFTCTINIRTLIIINIITNYLILTKDVY